MKRTPLARTTPLKRGDGKARTTVPVPKAKKCRACKEPFLAVRAMQFVCSGACGHAIAVAKREKEEAAARALDRAETRRRKEALKTRKDHEKDAQKAFNRYIRLRDAGQNCIDCNKLFEPNRPGGAVDAGHYLSVGSAPNLRFDERNVHAQRKNCNRPGGTTRAAFRAGMIDRIGLDAVEALEADQAPKHYSADDLKAIKATYAAKARELLKAAS